MIDARDVRKSFPARSAGGRGREILRGMTLSVEKGETLVLIGRSGCGKSVFLKHLIGLVHPDSGTITVDGIDWKSLKGRELIRRRLRIGMLFQGAALFDSLTIGENVGFALAEHSRLKSSEIRARVAEALEHVGLAGIEQMKPSEISGGMRKRVGLARAICMKPEAVLYDEPTTGLDPINADAINSLIVELNKRLNITSVVVTHDMKSAYKIASRIAMMYEGKIRQIGKPGEIEHSKDPVVKQFVAGSAQGPITEGAKQQSAAAERG